MDVEVRLWEWWRCLTDEQRAKALSTTDNVPPWMASSLRDVDIIVIDADLSGDGHVRLMPTRVREFLEHRQHAIDLEASAPST